MIMNFIIHEDFMKIQYAMIQNLIRQTHKYLWLIVGLGQNCLHNYTKNFLYDIIYI